MAENFLAGSQAIEAEIAQLQKKIEEKRSQLERQSGIIEETELVRGAVEDIITESQEKESETKLSSTLGLSARAKTPSVASTEASYLDRLDDESVSKLNAYIAEIGQRGIAPTLKKVKAESPFIVNALRDTLVDKLYEELKSRGFC